MIKVDAHLPTLLRDIKLAPFMVHGVVSKKIIEETHWEFPRTQVGASSLSKNGNKSPHRRPGHMRSCLLYQNIVNKTQEERRKCYKKIQKYSKIQK